MRSIGYGIGFILALGAGACVIAELLRVVVGDGYASVALGEIWYAIHGNSLVGFQATVEKTLTPLLWTPIQTLLTLPGWLVLGIPGLLLFVTCRPRQRGFDRF